MLSLGVHTVGFLPVASLVAGISTAGLPFTGFRGVRFSVTGIRSASILAAGNFTAEYAVVGSPIGRFAAASLWSG